MIAVTRLDAETFEVDVDGHGAPTRHRVRLDDEAWRRLTGGAVSPEGLLMEAFRFLLAREPNTGILPEFELDTIGHYFPEWPEHVRGWIDAGR